MEQKLRFEQLPNDLLKCPICGFLVSKFERKKVYNHAFKKHHGQLSTKLNDLTVEEKRRKNKLLTAQRVKKCRLLKKLCSVDLRTEISSEMLMSVVTTTPEVYDTIMSSNTVTATSLNNESNGNSSKGILLDTQSNSPEDDDNGRLNISHYHHHQHNFGRQVVSSYTSSFFPYQVDGNSNTVDDTKLPYHHHNKPSFSNVGGYSDHHDDHGQQSNHKRKSKQQSMLNGLKLFQQKASETIHRMFTSTSAPTVSVNHNQTITINDDHHDHEDPVGPVDLPTTMTMTMSSGDSNGDDDELIQEDIISIIGMESITRAFENYDTFNYNTTTSVSSPPLDKIFFTRKGSRGSLGSSSSLAASSSEKTIYASRNNSNVILSSRNDSGASYLSFVWTTRDNSNASIV